MDFKKFESWCKNRGFIITLPSGYVRVNNIDVKSFESFKGLFSLCMLFFQEELSKAFEKEVSEEKEKKIIPLYKDGKNSASAYYSSDNGGVSTLERIYENKKENKVGWCDIAKADRERYENAKAKIFENSDLKHLVDKVADKYDSLE